MISSSTRIAATSTRDKWFFAHLVTCGSFASEEAQLVASVRDRPYAYLIRGGQITLLNNVKQRSWEHYKEIQRIVTKVVMTALAIQSIKVRIEKLAIAEACKLTTWD